MSTALSYHIISYIYSILYILFLYPSLRRAFLIISFITKLNSSGLRSLLVLPVFILPFSSDKIPLDFSVVKVKCPFSLYNFKQKWNVLMTFLRINNKRHENLFSSFKAVILRYTSYKAKLTGQVF
jgi:hypothetical protein